MATEINKNTTIAIPIACLIVTIGSIVTLTAGGTRKISDIENKILINSRDLYRIEEEYKEYNAKQDIQIDKNSVASEEIKTQLSQIQTDMKWVITLLEEQRKEEPR